MAPTALEFSEFVHRRAAERDWAIANGFNNGDPETNGEFRPANAVGCRFPSALREYRVRWLWHLRALGLSSPLARSSQVVAIPTDDDLNAGTDLMERKFSGLTGGTVN